MPCSDSSSGLNIRLDAEERFISFEFAKITCSQEISAQTGYSTYCVGMDLTEILDHNYFDLVRDLRIESDEERQFILHLEWDALRAGIAQYLGIDHESIDKDRCRITSIEYTGKEIEISEVILPPKEMPKIISCRQADTN